MNRTAARAQYDSLPVCLPKSKWSYRNAKSRSGPAPETRRCRADGPYMIQVGSFRSSADADSLPRASDLARSGYEYSERSRSMKRPGIGSGLGRSIAPGRPWCAARLQGKWSTRRWFLTQSE